MKTDSNKIIQCNLALATKTNLEAWFFFYDVLVVWSVEENTEHGVLLLGEHPQRRKTNKAGKCR